MIQEDNAYYIREPGGSLIARVDGTDTSYYHFDALGSTVMLTDSTGTETDRYAYDAWGATLAHTGSSSQPYQYVGQLGYYTHHQTPDFGLMQLGVRFYDPEVGRFGQRDPQKVGNNFYVYCNEQPTYLVDPYGMKPTNKKKLHYYDKCLNKCKSNPRVLDTLKSWTGEFTGCMISACIGAEVGGPLGACCGGAVGFFAGNGIEELAARLKADAACKQFCGERSSRYEYAWFDESGWQHWFEDYYQYYSCNTDNYPQFPYH